ncbi:hypothetical protein LAT59_00410 [Candidatus Gracilibacteria bacterium]|nr:hypothetical protein [Candidatus Gracilibacteria bacterium]
MLAEYLKNPGQRGLGLDALAKRKFQYDMKSYDEVSQKKKLRFDEVDLEVAANYSGEDVYMTWKLYSEQGSMKDGNPSPVKPISGGVSIQKLDILQDMELPLLKILSDMEMRGIRIDRDFLKGLEGRLEQAIGELESEIYELAGEDFNIKSPKQVGELLFGKLGLPRAKKTKTGYSVDSEVLEELAKKYPIAALISKHRHYSKLLSTYVIGLLEVADEDDRIHTSFNQTVTATGRLSSTNPNLQNIPHGDDVAGEIRKAFIPYREEDMLVAFDYSQIEVRLLALMSGDENLLGAFRDMRDIHQVTAEFIFKKNTISSTERKFAKAVNFGVIYGISPFGLSKMLDIPQKDSRHYIDTFYASYPKVREFYDTLLEKARKTGYVETLFGRRRYTPSINDRNKMIASGAEREAINMPIQGSNADIIKLAMLQIQEYLDKNNCKSVMLLQVHDELIFNIVPEEKETLLVEIPRIMENIIPNSSIHLKADAVMGKSWKECK